MFKAQSCRGGEQACAFSRTRCKVNSLPKKEVIGARVAYVTLAYGHRVGRRTTPEFNEVTSKAGVFIHHDKHVYTRSSARAFVANFARIDDAKISCLPSIHTYHMLVHRYRLRSVLSRLVCMCMFMCARQRATIDLFVHVREPPINMHLL